MKSYGVTNTQSFADTAPRTTPEKGGSENLVKPGIRVAPSENFSTCDRRSTRGRATLTAAEIRQVLDELPEDMEWTQIRAKLFAQLHRAVRSRGERHHRAKLADADIPNVLELRRGGMSYTAIARKFETTKANVASICKGRTRRIPSPEERAGYT